MFCLTRGIVSIYIVTVLSLKHKFNYWTLLQICLTFNPAVLKTCYTFCVWSWSKITGLLKLACKSLVIIFTFVCWQCKQPTNAFKHTLLILRFKPWFKHASHPYGHIIGEHHITWLPSSWEYTTITKSWFQSFCQLVFIK